MMLFRQMGSDLIRPGLIYITGHKPTLSIATLLHPSHPHTPYLFDPAPPDIILLPPFPRNNPGNRMGGIFFQTKGDPPELLLSDCQTPDPGNPEHTRRQRPCLIEHHLPYIFESFQSR